MATIAAIVLAAGSSTRMGSPKQLLEWGGQTLIEYQIAQLRQSGAERVIVVLGHRADEIRPLVEHARAEAIINEDYRNGRASSQRMAAAALSDDTRIVVVLNVDQPRPHSITKRLIEEHQRRASLISLPTFGGHRGHPPVLDGWLLPELREVQQVTRGLRALIRRHDASVVEVPCDSDVVLLDINNPEEYERAKRSYFAKVTA